jgi:hypothetical protein
MKKNFTKGHTKKWKAENAVLGVLLCARQTQLQYSSEASLLQTLQLLRELLYHLLLLLQLFL